MDPLPPNSVRPAPPPRKSNPRQIIYGFLTGVGLFGLGFLFPSGNYGAVLPYLLAVTLLPLAAVVLAIIRPTRKFGLGMLLACGVLWLVLVAICGGLVRSIR